MPILRTPKGQMRWLRKNVTREDLLMFYEPRGISKQGDEEFATEQSARSGIKISEASVKGFRLSKGVKAREIGARKQRSTRELRQIRALLNELSVEEQRKLYEASRSYSERDRELARELSKASGLPVKPHDLAIWRSRHGILSTDHQLPRHYTAKEYAEKGPVMPREPTKREPTKEPMAPMLQQHKEPVEPTLESVIVSATCPHCQSTIRVRLRKPLL